MGLRLVGGETAEGAGVVCQALYQTLPIRCFTRLHSAHAFSPLDLCTGCALCLEASSFHPLLTLQETEFFLQGLDMSEKSPLMPRLG